MANGFWKLVATVVEMDLKRTQMAVLQRDAASVQERLQALDHERKALVEEMGFDPEQDYALDKDQETLVPLKREGPSA